MNHTLIPWVKNPDGTPGYTWNPITGCLNCTPDGLCKGGMFPCYAYKKANGRLRTLYLANKYTSDYDPYHPRRCEHLDDPFYPRLWEDRMWDLRPEGQYDKAWNRDNSRWGSEKGIFVCDMSDLFGIGIPEGWTNRVLEEIKIYSQHRFYLLTKQPQNMIKFSPFPDNCWVGATATTLGSLTGSLYYSLPYLSDIEAKVKYISFEPLLESVSGESLDIAMQIVDWVVCGSCTGTKPDMEALIKRYPQLTLMPWGKKWTAQPPIEWVEEITKAADYAGISVFHKDNLKPIFPIPTNTLRQEMPSA